MYYLLTEAVERRYIEELRRYFSAFPQFSDIVENIQDKFSFKTRPQYGIIVKPTGGNRQRLSPDNYIGMDKSYVMLGDVKGHIGFSVEWVYEDKLATLKNNNVFPSPPGLYYIEILEDLKFKVDVMLRVTNEIVTLTSPTEGSLAYAPHRNTLRLQEYPQKSTLFEDVNYVLEKDAQQKPTGNITFLQPIAEGREIVACYLHPGESTGPFDFYPDTANHTAIPGAILAFGQRYSVGDIQVVEVNEVPEETAKIYGGKWEIGTDMTVTARDIHACRRMHDQTAMYLESVLSPRFSTEGLEIIDITMGGESEEVYDDNAEDYIYNAELSVTTNVSWEIAVPLPLRITEISSVTRSELIERSVLTDEDYPQGSDVKIETGSSHRDPFFVGRNSNFEVIV